MRKNAQISVNEKKFHRSERKNRPCASKVPSTN